ncbi:sodium/proton antiporter (NhaA family) [Roseimicrobium gellanilyticum]|uniref:Na(+)/H(+) antiporter NhaA n=1 Tax=Roseimicrobium gellanilyticum TaxID=748857 RepID=A0A366HMG2_9BACT|nr:Na+/H+ antiporter NhaA [Roseimicrobium gellanilyticum]RBP44263.1 sodium/proton antiporter (NhaA family) [Roseimicrobium gellanilyticum]
MTSTRPTKLERPVDPERDHILGNPDAELTLVEYGNYTRRSCHLAHEVVADLRDRFGERLRYVFRHRPAGDSGIAKRAAELAEYAYLTTGEFWPVHDALMKGGHAFTSGDFERLARDFNLPPPQGEHAATLETAKVRVKEDVESAHRSGVVMTPTFFINGRRYEGTWDENTLADAMLGTLGHRVQTAALNFARWAPSAGLLLLFMSVLAVFLANSAVGPAFSSLWSMVSGIRIGDAALNLSLIHWINDGLLAIFFLVVGLEIKREFTTGRLSTLRSGALPVIAALGGILVPVAIYLFIAPPGPLAAGWAVPIATDTAFAVAIIVLLGARVPVELRVFLTAAVIIDDLVAIAIIAAFYTETIHMNYLMASAGVTLLLVGMNRCGIYRPLPYILAGIVLWVLLHESGLHATLAGVILALVTPARPPAKLHVLLGQAEAIIRAETRRSGDALMRHGLSEPAMRELDAIHDRTESPADKLLRTMEPWSSYLVLPLFALANAGVVLSWDVFQSHGSLMLAIILGLVVGKPAGILFAAWLAVRLKIATKPPEYSWRQVAGAGALAGIGFTMSLFIAGEAFPEPVDFAAAKIAIFTASIIAGVVGTAILWPNRKRNPIP